MVQILGTAEGFLVFLQPGLLAQPALSKSDFLTGVQLHLVGDFLCRPPWSLHRGFCLYGPLSAPIVSKHPRQSCQVLGYSKERTSLRCKAAHWIPGNMIWFFTPALPKDWHCIASRSRLKPCSGACTTLTNKAPPVPSWLYLKATLCFSMLVGIPAVESLLMSAPSQENCFDFCAFCILRTSCLVFFWYFSAHTSRSSFPLLSVLCPRSWVGSTVSGFQLGWVCGAWQTIEGPDSHSVSLRIPSSLEGHGSFGGLFLTAAALWFQFPLHFPL